MSDLQAIRDLEAKATPPPWSVDVEYDRRDYGIDEITTIGPKNGDYAFRTDYPVADADAALIAALRNAAPALLDAADILRELVDVMLLRKKCDLTEGPTDPAEFRVWVETVFRPMEKECVEREAAIMPRAKAWREGQP